MRYYNVQIVRIKRHHTNNTCGRQISSSRQRNQQLLNTDKNRCVRAYNCAAKSSLVFVGRLASHLLGSTQTTSATRSNQTNLHQTHSACSITQTVHLFILFREHCSCAFSALTLLVWCQEGHPVCKNRVVGYWRGYLSGARCRLAYGPADGTATHCLLLQLNPGWLYLSGGSEQRAVKRVCVCCSLCRFQQYDCVIIRFVE